MRCDLHAHTTASDGRLSPAEVVALARQQRLNALAITDHDTTAGIPPAQAVAAGMPAIIPGIELSALDAGEDVHVLGYYLDIAHAALQARLARFRDERIGRGEAMARRLGELGKPISWARVLELADGASVTRPHLARVMVEAGYAASQDEAFARWLANDAPAYIPREKFSPEEAIVLVHQAGGAAVLAHPGLVANYLPLLERLAVAGLDGVELIHPQNGGTVRENVRGLAARCGLALTGGSDFHHPGDPMGAYLAPADALARLRERIATRAG